MRWIMEKEKRVVSGRIKEERKGMEGRGEEREREGEERGEKGKGHPGSRSAARSGGGLLQPWQQAPSQRRCELSPSERPPVVALRHHQARFRCCHCSRRRWSNGPSQAAEPKSDPNSDPNPNPNPLGVCVPGEQPALTLALTLPSPSP